MLTSLRRVTLLSLAVALAVSGAAPAAEPPAGFTSLFNGKDFTGWTVPAGDGGHWKVLDGVIDYDAQSQAPGDDKNLWSVGEYGDFVLKVEWRLKETPFINPNVPIIRFDGTHKKGPDGKEIKLAVPDSDSGIFLRGSSKSQVNIWCWPTGSGEVYGYRMDEKMPDRGARRRHPEGQRRQGHRRVERVRDHDEGRPAHRRPERHHRDRERRSCPASPPGAGSRSSTTARRRTASGRGRPPSSSSATSRSRS